MRFHILSDIHDDHSRADLGTYDIPDDLDADAILIAGDIAGRLSRMGLRWLERQRERTGLPIILIAGNHDFWRSSLDCEIGRFRDRLQMSGIHILDGDSLEIGGCQIIGGTLWTDYEIYSDPNTAHMDALKYMTDMRYIRARRYQWRLYPWMLREEHERQRAAIESAIQSHFDGPTIVMTHHAPSARSLLDPSRIQPLDASYASDLEDLILRYRPTLWIHGHVHHRLDYEIGSTRIICNPRGYQEAPKRHRRDESEATGFDPRLTIEIGNDRIPLDGVHCDVAIDC